MTLLGQMDLTLIDGWWSVSPRLSHCHVLDSQQEIGHVDGLKLLENACGLSGIAPAESRQGRRAIGGLYGGEKYPEIVQGKWQRENP